MKEKKEVKHPYLPKKNLIAMAVITGAMVVINLCAWVIDGFADFYVDNVFSKLNALCVITSAVPFSVGEILIIIGVLLVTVVLIGFIVALIVMRKNKVAKAKLLRVMALMYGWVIVYIITTETFNCFISYHTTEFSEKYLTGYSDGYTSSQLIELTEIAVEKVNYYSTLVERDDDGNVIIPDNINELSKAAMLNISDEYEILKGVYTTPKVISSTVIMTQLSLQGIYFPFTLESNYNGELMPARVPSTICHEMSHAKGIIREDEASFVAFRACTSSDEALLNYSGWITALNYLYKAVKSNCSESTVQRIYSSIDSTVLADNQFVSEEFKEVVEETAVIATETVEKVSEVAMDTSLKLNGVEDGKQSYGRVVDLLLEYYYYF